MGLRRSAFLLLCAVLGCAVAVLPAVAGSETSQTIEAVNSKGIYEEQRHYWSPSLLTIGPGAVVILKNTGTVPHGVRWLGGPATPACEKVPVDSSAANWEGTCTFTAPGTYTFDCTVHGAEMTGKVTVGGGEVTTTSTSTTTGITPPPGGTTSVPSSSGPSPATVLPAAVVALARNQHGTSVHGSLQVPSSAAGGRLEVELLASRASLAATGGSAPVRVGRLVRSQVHAGRLSFAVALGAKARRALSRRHRLRVSVRIVLTPPRGSPSSTSRSVLLHR